MRLPVGLALPLSALSLLACTSAPPPAPAKTGAADPRLAHVRTALYREAGEIGLSGNPCAGRDDGECSPDALRGAVHVGAIRAVGRLARAEIAAVVDRHAADFAACYDRRLKADPTLRGTVVTLFRIGPMGTPRDIQDGDSPIDDRELVHCVQKVVVGFEFPAPEAGVVDVSLPLLFDGARR